MFPEVVFAINPIMVFGILLVGGALGGYLAHRINWLPSITGFMLVGVLMGPEATGLLGMEALGNSAIISEIALSLILYQLGSSLNVRKLGRRPYVFAAAVSESVVSFLAVFIVLHFSGFSLAISGLAAAIFISSSPAVLVHVAHEMRAAGKITETGKALVAINNVLAFVAFSLVLPLSHLGSEYSVGGMALQSFYRFLGSACLGGMLGLVLVGLARVTQEAVQYRFALIIGAVMLMMGVADVLGLSKLFAPLVMGIVVRMSDREKLLKQVEFGSGFELFFIALFVLAGANLHLAELWQLWPVVLSLVLARSLGKYLAVLSAGLVFRRSREECFSTGLLLVPMAGMAIGLTQAFHTLDPAVAASLTAIVLGSVAVFETVGPVLVSYALRLSGEAGSDEETGNPQLRQ